MKGKISLKDFIKEVKEDLRSAVDEDDPFFIMESVTLEVSFGLEVEAGGSVKFVVFDLSSKAKAQQTHKVSINLTPFLEGKDDSSGGGKPTYLIGGRPTLKKRPSAKGRGHGPVMAKAAAKAKKKAVKKKRAKKKMVRRKVLANK